MSDEARSDSPTIAVDAHPHLDLRAFEATLPDALGGMPSPEWLRDLLRSDAPSPFSPDDDLRRHVRDLLRHGGYKPTGRGKPSSEYLVRAAAEGQLGTINLVVDACNAASLHGGLPISVVDLDRTEGALRVGIAEAGTRHVFNASGQEIDVSGLLCLHDAAGPCANAVKDAQRTKTGPATRRTLALTWGTVEAPGRAEAVEAWHRELLERAGVATRCVRAS